VRRKARNMDLLEAKDRDSDQLKTGHLKVIWGRSSMPNFTVTANRDGGDENP